ncbi:MAG: EF-P lysine aminoacylase EpmA [Planctomycetota bacterium]|nr:EF-P lysine aminoacylase EpmA [Planctomycetota bacterium]
MPYLMTINGMDAGRIHSLVEGQLRIGRGPDCQLLLDADSVSRHHATLHLHGHRCTVEDHDSRNGTFLNNRRVRKLVVVSEGDELRIGNLSFSFHLTADESEQESVEKAASSPAPSFQSSAGLEMLRQRAALVRRSREFFDQRGFMEVETPLVSRDTVVDRHIEPVPVTISGQRMWLQTSPEFAMKRLLASGATAIYQLTRAFRDDEQGSLHNPEFTILEWYRCGDSMDQAMDLLDELSQQLLDAGPARRITYQQAFQQCLDFDPLSGSTSALLKLIASLEFQPPDNWRTMDRDGWLHLLLAEFIEPWLSDQPTILYDYPASQAALAVIRQDDPPVAERFELYVNGVELANGYHELLDAGELRRRNEEANQLRIQDGRPGLPVESQLLEAMQSGMADCSGVALGVDRLVMLASGVTDIQEVIAFPFERA